MTFDKLVEGLSSKLGVEIENAGGAFAVEVDGQTVVMQLAGGVQADIVLMRADLGDVPPGRRDAFAAAALEANWLYQGTGGATLALCPGDGHLHLQRYDWMDRLDVDRALELISRFAETALAWKSLASEAGNAPATPERGAGDGNSGEGRIDAGEFMQV